MGCIVNGPGESKHADIGISLPGTGEALAALVYRREKETHLAWRCHSPRSFRLWSNNTFNNAFATAPERIQAHILWLKNHRRQGMNDILPAESSAWEWL